jgi:hypothetical protein
MSSEKLIKNEFNKPCGCHVVEYSDETAGIALCISCGLMETARALNGAAQALSSVARTIAMSRQQAMIQQAVKGVSS